MSATAPRNACPTIARPMETGDGLLARLPPLGPLALDAIRAIGDAAARFGNGIVEVSSRGSVQARGLSPASAPAFAAALAAIGIRDSRPAIHVPPLAGLDHGVDVRPLAGALRVAAAPLGARLAPKASVVIDGGGGVSLDAIDADVRLVAAGSVVALAIGGTAATARPVGLVRPDRAVAAATTVLEMMAEAGMRARDLDPSAVVVPGATPGMHPAPHRSEPIGTHRLRGGRIAIGIGLAFGQADAAVLAALVDAAEAAGATALAPAPGRALLAIGVRDHDSFRRHAAARGFIVDAGDPRRAVVACAGAPACGAGRMPAREIAASLTNAAAPILDGTVTLHVSGCRKGCAMPRAASLALVGTGEGLALAVNGRAMDAVPIGPGTGDSVTAAARLSAAVADARRPGETAADAIARLRAGGVAALLRREPVDA